MLINESKEGQWIAWFIDEIIKYESVELAFYMCAIQLYIAAKCYRVIIYLHSLIDGLKNYLLRNEVHRKLNSS